MKFLLVVLTLALGCQVYGFISTSEKNVSVAKILNHTTYTPKPTPPPWMRPEVILDKVNAAVNKTCGPFLNITYEDGWVRIRYFIVF